MDLLIDILILLCLPAAFYKVAVWLLSHERQIAAFGAVGLFCTALVVLVPSLFWPAVIVLLALAVWTARKRYLNQQGRHHV